MPVRTQECGTHVVSYEDQLFQKQVACRAPPTTQCPPCGTCSGVRKPKRGVKA